MRTEELVEYYPFAYHMAESGTWASIQKHGLLSTFALLDLFEITGARRNQLMRERRPDSVVISHATHGRAVIRDQKPMSESALRKCLEPSISPSEWCVNLNGRVFFWLSRKRLDGLLSARAYRSKRHCVLTVRTDELLARHHAKIALSPINSGSTIFNPQPRGSTTFLRVGDYPFDKWRAKRAIANAVVELVVDYAVPDVKDFVTEAVERQGDQVIQRLYRRP